MYTGIKTMNDQEFVSTMQTRWNLFFKFQPRQADLTVKRLSLSSSLCMAKTEEGFNIAIDNLLSAENNPQVFEFIKNDWKKARDLMNLALASR